MSLPTFSYLELAERCTHWLTLEHYDVSTLAQRWGNAVHAVAQGGSELVSLLGQQQGRVALAPGGRRCQHHQKRERCPSP